MNGGNPEDGLQSSLWDRLREQPRQLSRAERRVPVGEPTEATHLRRRKLRELEKIAGEIQRDLLLLLTTRDRSPEPIDSRWPHLATSVLRYGLPDFSGKTASGLDLQAVSKVIKTRVIAFEPRLHAESVEVHCEPSDHPDAFVVFIGGQFGPRDQLQTLTLEATLSLASGQIAAELAKVA
jgi:type VI secretion system protein ImpF